MKKTALFLLLVGSWISWVGAQETTTTVQVAPSDQIIYPDASQVLNKTEPKATPKPTPSPTPTLEAPTGAVATTPPQATLPTTKPLVAAAPVLAATPAPRTLPAAPVGPQWYLRWTVTGDEAGVRAWATAQGLDAQIAPLGPELWEVLVGPLGQESLGPAWKATAGQAALVRR